MVSRGEASVSLQLLHGNGDAPSTTANSKITTYQVREISVYSKNRVNNNVKYTTVRDLPYSLT